MDKIKILTVSILSWYCIDTWMVRSILYFKFSSCLQYCSFGKEETAKLPDLQDFAHLPPLLCLDVTWTCKTNKQVAGSGSSERAQGKYTRRMAERKETAMWLHFQAENKTTVISIVLLSLLVCVHLLMIKHFLFNYKLFYFRPGFLTI